MQIPPQLFFFLILPVFVTFIILVFWLEKKRKDELKAASAQLGLTYFGQPTPGLSGRLNNFEFFNKGDSRSIYNVIAGEWHNFGAAVFDYKYTTGSGENSHTYTQTVICFNTQELQFPKFILMPETFFDTIAAFFGYNDIDFADFPGFSKRYLLRSPQETLIRAVFAPHVIKFFEENSKRFIIEAKGQDIIIYKSNCCFEPKELRTELDEAVRIANLFGNR